MIEAPGVNASALTAQMQALRPLQRWVDVARPTVSTAAGRGEATLARYFAFVSLLVFAAVAARGAEAVGARLISEERG